jgi:hypothetical protein
MEIETSERGIAHIVKQDIYISPLLPGSSQSGSD